MSILKPAVKKWKAWSVEYGVEGYDEVESVSSHRHHHQREPGGGVTPCSEDVKRARKERGGWRGRRRGREGKGEGEDLNAGTDATQAHDEAEEPVSSYYFYLANLSSSSRAKLSYTESSLT